MFAAMSKVTSLTFQRICLDRRYSTDIISSAFVPLTMATIAPLRPLAALLVMIV